MHATAALTAIGWLVAGASIHDAIVIAIAVLIITCPCAIALAIPAVQVVAAGALFRSGVILNGGDAIERLAEADTVVFDKTGNADACPSRASTQHRYRARRARAGGPAGTSSRHPLAAALARQARERKPYPGAVEEPGQGVRAIIDGDEARLGSANFCGVAQDERSTATQRGDASFITFAHAGKTARPSPIRQTLRPDAAAVTKALRERGLRLMVLSATGPPRSRRWRSKLGIERLARRPDADRENRHHRNAEIAGPPRPHGRRRIERRAGACRGARVDLADYRRAPDPGACRCAVPRRPSQAGAAAPWSSRAGRAP